MDIKPLHLSHSVQHGDGGIAFAVNDLMSAQQELGIYTRWLTADRYPVLGRDRRFAKNVIHSGASILHCHGLWRTQTRVASQFIHHGFPIIISPHGMMDEWAMAHSSWKKEIVWHLWESQVLRSSVCLHALCDAEASAIHRRLPGKPVAVIPNGVNRPKNITYSRELLPWSNEIPEDEKVLLFLGRFHQKKGIEPLMTAWQSTLEAAERSGWWLVLVGFGDQGKFQSQLEACPVDRCFAYGPVFGEKKAASFQHSSAFILPSYSEGLPMAALEAMSYGLPCLLSNACNLPQAYSARAAFVAEPDSSRLIDSLQKLFLLTDQELKIMGQNGQVLTKTHFYWKHVAEMMSEVYSWMLEDISMPSFVRTV